MRHTLAAVIAITLAGLASPGQAAQDKPTPSAKEILAASRPAEWQAPDPANLLYMKLPTGTVVIELAQAFSPLHAANIRTLVRGHYFDGLAIIRVQDNFVTQWGDAEEGAKARPLGKAAKTVPAEFTRAIQPGQPFVRLPDGDFYAPQVGYSGDFPVGRDPRQGTQWLPHCYGMVGIARDTDPVTGNGASLYAVIGSARRLDHNLPMAGRVLKGMPLLSSLPRGAGEMGFYTDAAQRLPIESVRLAADLPASERLDLQVLRSDSASFAALIDARRSGRSAFYPQPVGKVDVCDMLPPVRLGGKPVAP